MPIPAPMPGISPIAICGPARVLIRVSWALTPTPPEASAWAAEGIGL